MDTRGRRLTLEGPPRGNPLTFPFGLAEFCVDAVTTCFSQNSEKRCIPIGLSFLSMLVLLLSCFLFVYQRCTFRGEASGGTISLYGFLGDLCSTIGAILSRQLHIQVLMGAFAATVDAVNCISCCSHVLLHWNSREGRRLRMMKGRRRQHLLAVCVLMVVAGGFWKSRASHLPAVRPPLDRRRLLFATLQDNTEVLGYVLGLLSCVIACTSRFPALCRAYRGLVLTRANMFSRLLCSLSGALYAAAVLLCDTRVGFLLRVMPWLLSATGCVTIDLLILVVHCWRRGTTQKLTSVSPDEESLLSSSCALTEDNAVMKRPGKQQLHSSAGTKTNVRKVTEMGGYMDVDVDAAGEMCLKEAVEARCLSQTVRVIRVDSFCSSDTSCDSSLVDSDLEVGWSPV
uniref:transmembrane protein 44 isoform X1 n=1 Tax=Gasterosteus aculeatus aculeatus TaxID=481459 RepID=UPI001A998200|nr:transmembrane protein 44 isoform X1 [Gasterosteus aculeatus aculeatus]